MMRILLGLVSFSALHLLKIYNIDLENMCHDIDVSINKSTIDIKTTQIKG